MRLLQITVSISFTKFSVKNGIIVEEVDLDLRFSLLTVELVTDDVGVVDALLQRAGLLLESWVELSASGDGERISILETLVE